MARQYSNTLLCAYCGIAFHVAPSRKPQGSRVFCCWEHRAAGATALHVIALRFWEKVARCEHGDACAACCWLWQGARMHDGYGKFYYTPEGEKPRYIRAHRFAWFLRHGRFPEPHGCHDCPDGDNPLCVNDHHLWEGDYAANNADAKAKGRTAVGDRNGSRRHPEAMPRGEQHYRTQQTVEKIRHIKQLFAQGVTQQVIAEQVGISRKQVWKIVHEKSWAHVQ